MKVSELIVKLQQLPADAEVGIAYDGGDRMDLKVIWLARSGRVIVGHALDPVYNLRDRTVDSTEHDSNHYLYAYEMLGISGFSTEDED